MGTPQEKGGERIGGKIDRRGKGLMLRIGRPHKTGGKGGKAKTGGRGSGVSGAKVHDSLASQESEGKTYVRGEEQGGMDYFCIKSRGYQGGRRSTRQKDELGTGR